MTTMRYNTQHQKRSANSANKRREEWLKDNNEAL